ncbi:MAG: hypothetical protein HC822_08470 [Oscillochloris sp.]|nr:hypothetical protein [Oscillochloris sp.]
MKWFPAVSVAPLRTLPLPFLTARWFWVTVAAFVISRGVVVLAAYLGGPLLNDAIAPPPYHLFGVDNLLLDVFASRWDTGFYLSIADEGYRYTGVPLPSVAFWPLLPLLMRVLGSLIGSTAVAGLIISNLALLGAALLLYRLTADEWGPQVAERAVWYLLIFPSAFFGSAIYSESLWLFCAVGALYMARRGWWESAAILAFAAALSRFVGVIVGPMLVLEWWRQRRNANGVRAPWPAVFAACAAPLGSGAYMGYLYLRFGDPLAFVHAAAAWEREPTSPLGLIAALFQTPGEGWLAAVAAGRLPLDTWIDAGFVLLFLTIAIVLLVQRRWPEAALMLPGVLIPLSSGLWMSQRRYMWVLFPAFIVLAQWGARPWVDRLITSLSLLGLALFTIMFANGYWVG